MQLMPLCQHLIENYPLQFDFCYMDLKEKKYKILYFYFHIEN